MAVAQDSGAQEEMRLGKGRKGRWEVVCGDRSCHRVLQSYSDFGFSFELVSEAAGDFGQ